MSSSSPSSSSGQQNWANVSPPQQPPTETQPQQPQQRRRRDSSPIASAISSILSASASRQHQQQQSMTEQQQGQQHKRLSVASADNATASTSTNFAHSSRRQLSQSQEQLGPSRTQSSHTASTSSALAPPCTRRLDGLVYLGCSKMDEPTSEDEMLSIMATLNAEKAHDAVAVSLQLVPGQQGAGIVRLLESGQNAPPATASAEICSFPISRIRFCARGKPNSAERGCFALSFTQVGSKNTGTSLHQCHVFRCQLPEQAAQALFCFAQAFRTAQQQRQQHQQQQHQHRHKSSLGNEQHPPVGGVETVATIAQSPLSCQELFEFEALLEIRERETAGSSGGNHGNKSTAAGCGGPVSAVAVAGPSASDDHDHQQLLQQQQHQQGFAVCPLERNCFKMRRDREKRVVVMLKQVAGPRHLRVKNCFGLLLAAGRNLRQSDMHLLEMQNTAEGQHKPTVFIAEARWNPRAQNFEVLNTETPRDTRVFMTIAVDVTFEGLNESVRFIVECKARIFQQFERFWSPSGQRRAVSETYTLLIQHQMDEQASTSSADSGICYADPSPAADRGPLHKVLRFESATERQRLAVSEAAAAITGEGKEKSPSRQMPTQLIHPADDDESDSDEPLLSGSGDVCRECSEDRLAAWKEMLEQWKSSPEERPVGLNAFIHDGVPDVLRGEVWLLLARVGSDQADLVQTYQMLLEKECPSDAVILRDIHRTFPAHEFFKEENAEEGGQKSLYRISKAYSLYDEEVGYCQGLSFLAAALLLHMPEEQAFCVLVRIMFDYGMRELFKTGFDALHLRFHQLQRLVKDYAHELYAHFYEVGVETHMYASQWFLTLFTAKFPLQMVFFIVDLFLAEGMNTIFHISLALLQDSKKELLQSDFEGILKFFRVNLPRKYRTEANAKELIHSAVKLKISHKRLAKYEKEWHELKRLEIESQDPLERLERKNCHLKEQILRLERENDDLAHELVTSKIGLQSRLDTTEDQLETTLNQVVRKSRECEELVERERQTREESEQLKQRCRLEVSRLEEEQRRTESVIAEYKRICTELGLAADEDKRQFKKQKRLVAARIASCDRCAPALADWCGAESPTQRPKSAMSNGSGSEQGTTADFSNGTSAMHMMELVERLQQREDHIRQVELELAQTKLALVESQCQNQDLSHQMSTSMMLQQMHLNNGDSSSSAVDNRPAWLKKTISSLREVAAQAQSGGSGTTNHRAVEDSRN